MSDELKPCPWCGRAPALKYPDEDGGCTLRHPIGKCGFLSGQVWLFATPEQAVEAWNRRSQ